MKTIIILLIGAIIGFLFLRKNKKKAEKLEEMTEKIIAKVKKKK